MNRSIGSITNSENIFLPSARSLGKDINFFSKKQFPINYFSKQLPALLMKGRYFDGYDTRTLSICPNKSYSRIGNKQGKLFDMNSGNDLIMVTNPVNKCS